MHTNACFPFVWRMHLQRGYGWRPPVLYRNLRKLSSASSSSVRKVRGLLLAYLFIYNGKCCQGKYQRPLLLLHDTNSSHRLYPWHNTRAVLTACCARCTSSSKDSCAAVGTACPLPRTIMLKYLYSVSFRGSDARTQCWLTEKWRMARYSAS